jgi:KAP family P-loop domain
MWSDNETTIDLLGFDYLVDSLEVLLTEPGLLPLTAGVLGDWGSGKTSLMRMAQERLDADDGYLTVFFSPWRYEAYEDVKAALIDTILNRLERAIPEDESEKRTILDRLRSMATRLRTGSLAGLRSFMPAGLAFAAPHIGIPVALATAAGTAAASGVEAAVASQPTAEEPSGPSVIESVTEFQQEFQKLLDSLEGVKAVVVFVDDLDRCLDETIIFVFEAIRLFLQVASTAFVLAANREIVQAAINRRYPASREGDPALGKDYLEKIIQIEVNVPLLTEAEAETYLNLLFAERRLDEAGMNSIRAAVDLRRRQGQFAVAMNYGIAKDALEADGGTVSPELTADFIIANRIAPTLSRGLRGNPRQLKRFLNTMLLRLETARRRSVNLDPAILAKLMVLEAVAPTEFQQLFLWQLVQDGAPEELATAEIAAAAGADIPSDRRELNSWYAVPAVQPWLRLEPALSGIALSEYFFFSRDRLLLAAPGTRLSAALQAMLTKLRSPVRAQRRAAAEAAAKLTPEEITPLYDALLDLVARRPDSDAMKGAIEMATKLPSVLPTLTAILGRVPPSNVPPALPLQLMEIGGTRPEVNALLDQWAASNNDNLQKAVARARKSPS